MFSLHIKNVFRRKTSLRALFPGHKTTHPNDHHPDFFATRCSESTHPGQTHTQVGRTSPPQTIRARYCPLRFRNRSAFFRRLGWLGIFIHGDQAATHGGQNNPGKKLPTQSSQSPCRWMHTQSNHSIDHRSTRKDYRHHCGRWTAFPKSQQNPKRSERSYHSGNQGPLEARARQLEIRP